MTTPMSDELDGCQAVLDDHTAADLDGRLALQRAVSDSSPTLVARGGHDTGIAARLRSAGLTVVEVAGWRTRGSSSFAPRGLVDHHTAGPRAGNAPSLNVCTFGRSDLPGPLCHVLVGRDNTCYVVAAGRANHAGTGGWKGLAGNSSVYGVERENVGTIAEPWRPDQTETACKVAAALIRGRAGADMVCAHREWSPRRKPDAHSVDYAAFRGRVSQLLAGVNPVPSKPPEVHPVTGSRRVAIAWTPTGDGYVVLFEDGGVANYGDAPAVSTVGVEPAGVKATSIAVHPSGGVAVLYENGQVHTRHAPHFGEPALPATTA